MTNRKQRSLISRMSLRALSATLAFAAVLVLAVDQTAQAQTFKILYTFGKGSDSGGVFPYGDLIRDAAGNIFGTTSAGGAHIGGTVYKLDKHGKETLLHVFTRNTGDGFPRTGLIRDAAGNFYGTTIDNFITDGCIRDCGSIFKLSKTGVHTVMHVFAVQDGANPEYWSLVRDPAGNLFGSTLYGGDLNCNAPYGCGTVFKLSPSGKYTVLHTFTDPAPDSSGTLIRDPAGNLYGVSGSGGNPSCTIGCGVVFKVNKAGKYSVRYSFAGGADGNNPFGGMVRDPAGNLYGTTAGGGAGWGTVFKLDTRGKHTVLYNFPGGAGGEGPQQDLTRDAVGNLYGTAYRRDSCNAGCPIVFKLDTKGKATVLHTFLSNGDQINGGLVLDVAGNVYGTTYLGGANKRGVVFKITP
jgi:uncharacterized repeat protein (TIGR03803 family)